MISNGKARSNTLDEITSVILIVATDRIHTHSVGPTTGAHGHCRVATQCAILDNGLNIKWLALNLWLHTDEKCRYTKISAMANDEPLRTPSFDRPPVTIPGGQVGHKRAG